MSGGTGSAPATPDARAIAMVAAVDESRGRCEICGCRLQEPYWPKGDGSIWLTPWHDCGGHCVTCMAHAGDPDCIESLREWIELTAASAA